MRTGPFPLLARLMYSKRVMSSFGPKISFTNSRRSPGRCGGSSGVPLRPSEGGAYKKLRKSKAPALP